MTENDVPDSTDWLSTPLSGLAAVENALRCQVCKDFYKTPMLTTCSHTFCSLCIRRALANDGKCPLCRSPEQELKLRSNWSLEETIDAFVKARPTTLQLARTGGGSGSTGKRKAEGESRQDGDAPEGKRVRSSARLRRNKADQPMADSFPEEEEDDSREARGGDDDAYVPEPDDGLVACPVCQSRMKDWQVFRHLESCSGPPPPTPKKTVTGSNTFDQIHRQQPKSLDRLPALNYSVLRDNALRKKLSELGISNQGPRTLLEKRHKEWITLWNANCDAARPKKRSELQHDLDIWERTQGGRLPMGRMMTQHTPMVKDKDFDAAAWAAKHEDSYKELIASARQSRMEARKKAEEAAKSSNAESSKKLAETSTPARSQPQADYGSQIQGSGALPSSQGLPHRVPRPGHQGSQGGSATREPNQLRKLEPYGDIIPPQETPSFPARTPNQPNHPQTRQRPYSPDFSVLVPPSFYDDQPSHPPNTFEDRQVMHAYQQARLIPPEGTPSFPARPSNQPNHPQNRQRPYSPDFSVLVSPGFYDSPPRHPPNAFEDGQVLHAYQQARSSQAAASSFGSGGSGNPSTPSGSQQRGPQHPMGDRPMEF